jgi:hypothetical protein
MGEECQATSAGTKCSEEELRSLGKLPIFPHPKCLSTKFF